jgi:uncharacterized protein YggE
MIKKWYLILFVVVAILSLSACSSLSGAQPAAVDKAPTEHTIYVSGNGKVYLTPDLAYVYIGVQSNAESVGDALTANNEKAQAISKTLQELGVQPKDIQTSSFNIYPIQQSDPEGKLLPVTYNVDNTVYVTVRDLSILGKLLDAVVRSGANTINSITFDVTDRSQALSEARKLAVEDARKQGDEVAAAAGVKITGVSNLSVNVSGGPIAMYDAKAVGGGNAAAAQAPISAGQLMISVDVSATYRIE